MCSIISKILEMNVIELYSGIGGMHYALKASGINGKIVAAVDINPNANFTYSFNFANSKVLNFNLDHFSADFIQKLDVNGIFMSPPCQPFTRNGLKKDVNDSRTKSFQHFLNILPKLVNIRYILLENVDGFQTSEMAKNWFVTLESCGFYFEQYLLSPIQFGIPNSRLRYYCIAAKMADGSQCGSSSSINEQIPGIEKQDPCSLSTFLSGSRNPEADSDKYYLPEKVLRKYLNVLDICHPESKRSCCFTKGYTHYAESTGSVFTNLNSAAFDKKLQRIHELDPQSPEYLELSKSLYLRYFTPNEVSKLMSFPDSFRFPDTISVSQRYRLLGNSLNITVVANLIKRLSVLASTNLI